MSDQYQDGGAGFVQHVGGGPEPGRPQVIATLLNTDDILEKLEYSLRGYVRNRQTGVWEERKITYTVKQPNGRYETVMGYRPMVNEIGVSRIMAVMETQISSLSQMAPLDIEHVYRLSREIALWILGEIRLNWQEWELDKRDWTTVFTLIDQTNFKACMQSFNDSVKDMLTKTHNVHETIDRSQPAPRPIGGGIFGRHGGQ